MSYKRILVPVDGGPVSAKGLKEAIKLARAARARLRLLHVVEPLPVLPEVPARYDTRAFEGLMVEQFEREVWPLVHRGGTQKEVRHGLAVETLLAAVAEWKADLLVVGSHGKGWVDRLLVGSVTERLLNALPTALLIVPVHAALARETVPRAQGAARLAPA